MKKAVFLAALLVGIVCNLCLAVADVLARRNTPQSTRQAMRLAPGNGSYAAQLAEEVYASDPAEAKVLLQRAVRLNRFDAGSWIQLGLLDEAANDLPQAEHSLLAAANVDKTFLPGWSLANFYFRQGNTGRFWYWAQQAAQIVPGDAAPLFRLAWYASPDARVIEDRLQLARPAVQAQFVQFLIAQGNPQAVSQAAAYLLPAHDPDSTATLVSACNWLLAQKRPGLALALWNQLASRFSYSPAGLASPLTNGSFSRSPTSHGFDWHLLAVDGVSSYQNDHPNALGFEFSGEEPDSFTLMTQTIPVQAQKAYRLAVDYTTTSIPTGSGLFWTIRDERNGALLARTASLAAEAGGRAETCFTTPNGASFAQLSLVYQRQPGTVRVEGKLALREVNILPGDCPPEKNSLSGADSPAF